MVNSTTISVLIYGADLNRSVELSQLLTKAPAIRVVGCYHFVDQSKHHTPIHEANIILTDLSHLVEISEIIHALSLSKTIVFTVSGVINLVEILKNRFPVTLINEPNGIKQHSKSIFTEQLTEREQEVLDYLVKGCSYKMIAYSMFISIDTVRSHIKKIYTKLEVNSKSEAVIKVLRAQHTY